METISCNNYCIHNSDYLHTALRNQTVNKFSCFNTLISEYLQKTRNTHGPVANNHTKYW